ncbi:hypothetical protein [Nonomuraea dietziae]|uniref:hypothetical protein n=1 Tax=Nonomuraea dietziae TaxID=65515 RepID=UPI0033D8ADFA
MSLLDTPGVPATPGALKQPLRVGVRRGSAAVVLSLHGELDLKVERLYFRPRVASRTMRRTTPPKMSSITSSWMSSGRPKFMVVLASRGDMKKTREAQARFLELYTLSC